MVWFLHRTCALIFSGGGNENRARQVLSNLSEPNETRLGLSSGAPSGRGVSGKQALDLYEALADSEAARSGILSEIAECDLFIPGISHDKVSDITTNVIRAPLIKYTQDQCDLLGITMRRGVAAGRVWDTELRDWKSVYAPLPVWEGRKVLLVPKVSVRYRMCLDSQEYYNHFILNYLQAEQLSASTGLVKVLQNGKRVVTKKDLKERFPFSKEFLFRFTRSHPDVLEEYKKIKGAQGTLPPALLDAEFDEGAFCDALSASLRRIPPGNDNASAFHALMIGALEFIFYPNLIYPKKETEIHEGRKRIDIVYTNAARGGFFQRLHTAHQVASNLVMVECKNYSTDVGNPELDQLAGRFSINRGRLGILVSRSFDDRELFIRRCRDTAQDGRGLILPLVDDDIHRMLGQIKEREHGFVDRFLEELYRRLIV